MLKCSNVFSKCCTVAHFAASFAFSLMVNSYYCYSDIYWGAVKKEIVSVCTGSS